MKTKIKYYLIGFISCLAITTFFVSAVYLYNAKDIEFTSKDSDWNVTNVEDAINDIKENYIPKNQFVGKVWEFNYIGKEDTFIPLVNGTYKLEVWGAQGGNASITEFGGYGAYSVGEIHLSQNETLYINVGGAGKYDATATSILGGYNGGGNVTLTNSYSSSGGGATHIAFMSGTLTQIGVSNLSKIIMIAGGGGGAAAYYNRTGITNHGGSAGGIQGENTINYSGSIGYNCTIYGGTQSAHTANDLYSFNDRRNSPGSFGQGGNAMGEMSFSSAGGGGYYGGTGGFGAGGGAGGSSYIGNTKLTNKATYCYNCVTSTASETKTLTNTCVNSNAEKECSKQGNGYARITLISID